MKILLLQNNVSGGAGIALRDQAMALEGKGHEVKALCLANRLELPIATTLNVEFDKVWTERCKSLVSKNNKVPVSNSKFSFPMGTLDLGSHPLVCWADVLHLHFVSEFLDPLAIKILAATGKKIFWTHHDYWAMSSGEHYNFVNDLDRGYLHLVRGQDLARKQLLFKKECFENLPITHICLNSKFAHELKASGVMGQDPDTVVLPNCVNQSVFRPIEAHDRRQVRAQLNLNDDDFVIFISAQTLLETRKNFDALVGLVNMLSWSHKVRVIAPSNHPQKITEILGDVAVANGHIDQQDQLNLLYNASDLTLVTSYQETFGLTIAESLAAGTRVLSSPHNGVTNFSQNPFFIVSEEFSAASLFEAFSNVSNSEKSQLERQEISESCQDFSLQSWAANYEDLLDNVEVNEESNVLHTYSDGLSYEHAFYEGS